MFSGIDIGGTKCAVVLSDLDGNIIDKIRFNTTDPEETISNIVSAVKKITANKTVFTCGISCGGPLDEKKGIVMSPPNLPGWDNIRITDIIEKETGIPCALKNDANACAIAEHLLGAGKDTENMLFLTFGTGLGAGIIMDGRLISGVTGLAGEIGHIRLEDDGPEGYGKKGSFEGFCSGAGLKKLGKSVAEKHIKNGITPSWYPDCDVAVMADYARKNDPAAKEVFKISAEKLGKGLSILIDIFNPEKIIIGSVYARCRDLFEETMLEVLKKEALPEALKNCRVVPAELGESIGDMAAIAVAMDLYKKLN